MGNGGRIGPPLPGKAGDRGGSGTDNRLPHRRGSAAGASRVATCRRSRGAGRAPALDSAAGLAPGCGGCLFKELRADLRRSMPRSQGSMPMRSRRWRRGGLTTRVHAAVDAPCPATFPVTPGHGAGSPQAKGLLCGLAGPCQAIADAGCGRDLPDAAGIPAPVHFWRSARHRSRAGRHPPGRSLRKKRRTVACFLKPDQTLPPHRAPLRGNRRLVKGIPRQRRRNRMVS
ncbi:hypothetical protein SAMN04244548_00636 [Paracoccus pantotrophus]|nr:hypothetical protein SAMN04244548_00636 [Paracoccus pantotrophus]